MGGASAPPIRVSHGSAGRDAVGTGADTGAGASLTKPTRRWGLA